MEPIIKTCACGRSYTRAQWDELPDAAVYQYEGGTFEQRRCVCKSHIVIQIGEEVPGRGP